MNIEHGFLLSFLKGAKTLSTVIINGEGPPVRQRDDTLDIQPTNIKRALMQVWKILSKEYRAIGQKFLKNQAGELKLSVFDLLKQNKSIARNVTESYIEDVRNQVLQQYFMLTFSYKLKNFGSGKASSSVADPMERRGNFNRF